MRQTLFYIPAEVGGVPLIGFGILLAIWTVASAVWIAWLIRRQGFNADTRGYLPVMALVAAAIAFLLPQLATVSGRSETGDILKGVPIRGYGVLLLLAVVAGILLGVHRGRRRGISIETMLSLAFWLFLSGIVGARLFFVVEYWKDFQEPTLLETLRRIISITEGGLVVYGSFFGAAVATIVFVRKHRLPILVLGDVLAPAMLLGAAIGRIGCFMNGCCYGGVCEQPWAVTFPLGSPPYRHHVAQGFIPPPYGLHLPNRFPQDFDAAPVVRKVDAGSLAEQAGLGIGDRLVAINGFEVETVAEARDFLYRPPLSGDEVTFVTAADPSKVLTAKLPGDPPRRQPVHPSQI